MQILVVEDDIKLAEFLRSELTNEGYACDTASDGVEALEKLYLNPYDLIILDLILPKVSGTDVCIQSRKMGIEAPILILTAKDQVENKIQVLDLGADDYLVKPFSFEELVARIRALLRRGGRYQPPKLVVDDLILDPATKIAVRKGVEINLTTKEYALLEYFMRNPNIVLSKTEILEHVWDYNYEGLSNIVETYVKYLRKKLRINPKVNELIYTLRGSGYIMKAKK